MSIHPRPTDKGVRYDVRLRDGSGSAYQRTFTSKREAEVFQARELADRSRGLWVDPRKAEVKFSAWAEQWLDGDLNKRARTRYDDAGCIRLHLNPTLGERPLGAITPLEVRRLVTSWANSSPASVRRRYAVPRAIFASAVEADLLGRSPCRGIRLPQSPRTSRRVLHAPELAALAAAAGDDHRAMVYVAGVLGLRWGECAGLRVGRVDLDNRTLTVAESLSEVAGEVTFGPPKSAAGRRTLAMPDALATVLQEHLNARPTGPHDPDALVFVAPDGGPLRASNFRQRIWLPAVRKVGLDGFRFHDPHPAASTLVSTGVDVRTAQE